MKEAYGMLYEIENLLRCEIESTMVRNYGLAWMIKAPAENKYKPLKKVNSMNFTYMNFLSLANSYECTRTTLDKPLVKLRLLPSIRNKKAHNHLINKDEFELLKEVYLELKEVVTVKGNSSYLEIS